MTRLDSRIIFSWPRPDVRFGFQHDNFRANVRLDFRANFVLGIFELLCPRKFSSHGRPLRSAKPRTRSRVRLTSMDGHWCNKYGGTTVRGITQGKIRYALRSFKGQLRRRFRFRVQKRNRANLLLGWSLASNDARSFLHTHPRIAYCACGALLLYVVLLLVSFWKFYRRSLLTYAQLSELGYMPTEYFRVRRIQPYTVVSFTVLNWTLAFIISAVILFA